MSQPVIKTSWLQYLALLTASVGYFVFTPTELTLDSLPIFLLKPEPSKSIILESIPVHMCTQDVIQILKILEPDRTIQVSLAAESSVLDNRSAALASLGDKLKAIYLNGDSETPSSTFDYHAEEAAFYDESYALQGDIKDWNKRNSAFQAQVDIYNQMLEVNCGSDGVAPTSSEMVDKEWM
jgi:hypothetical protein